jgi:hypothetical protein
MPLLEGGTSAPPPGVGHLPPRRHSQQFSDLARAAIMTSANSSPTSETEFPHIDHDLHRGSNLMPPVKTGFGRSSNSHINSMKPFHPLPQQSLGGVGVALTDTPLPTAPNSPQMYETLGPKRQMKANPFLVILVVLCLVPPRPPKTAPPPLISPASQDQRSLQTGE